MTDSTIDYSNLKAGGVMRQVEEGLYSIRIRVPVGNLTVEHMERIASLAKQFGRGTVHLTMRQGVEIPSVSLEDMPIVKESLAEVGLQLGACGPRVRVVTACQGSKICPHGLADAPELALKLDAAYYGQDGLPHKFKLAVTGCPNSCIKPQENDVGFMAVAIPLLDEAPDRTCNSCSLCSETCPTRAIAMIDGKPVIDMDKCCRDGKCARICPTDAMTNVRSGWDVYVGGKWGREPRLGLLFSECLSDDEAIAIVARILHVYKRDGVRRERLRNTIDRVGFDNFRAAVLAVAEDELK